ncbi:MAG: TAXI family TRAP transporter solute-binding subunit [Methyloligellaceae bacterium]
MALAIVSAVVMMVGYIAWTAPFTASLRLGADRLNSEPHEMATAIAHVVQRTHPGVRITVVETAGSNENIKLLSEGKLDLALSRADVVSQENVSLVAVLYQDMFQLLVEASSDIRTIKDLEGRRVAIPPINSGQYRAFWFLANQYGVAPERVNAIPMPGPMAMAAIRQGDVEAVFRVRGPRNFRLRMLINQKRLRMIPIDQGAAMHLRQPAFRPAVIPKGTYRGDPPVPERDLRTVAVDRLLIARNDLRNTIVRAITRVLFEQRRDMALRTPLAALIRQPSLEEGTALPVHPGAAAYFDREKPSFLEEKAEFLALLLSFCVVVGSLVLGFNRRLNERRKGRIDDYTAELLELEKLAQTAKTIPELNAHKATLTGILASAVADMRESRINAEGLQLFSFVWESVNYTINDHEEQLRFGTVPLAPARAVPGKGQPTRRKRNHDTRAKK